MNTITLIIGADSSNSVASVRVQQQSSILSNMIDLLTVVLACKGMKVGKDRVNSVADNSPVWVKHGACCGTKRK